MMGYEQILGHCQELARKIDELISIRCPYESFDDPLSTIHFSHTWEMDKQFARRNLIELLKGHVVSHDGVNDLVEMLSTIDDEVLLECITNGPLFDFVIHDDGFYKAVWRVNNKRTHNLQLALEAIYEARFQRNQPNHQF